MIYWIINIIYMLLFIIVLLCFPPPPPPPHTEQWTIQLEQQLNVTWTSEFLLPIVKNYKKC